MHLTHGLLINDRADEAVALARRMASELPPDADVLLAALEAVEATAALFGAAPVAPERLASYRRLPLAPGTGPKLLAAIAAHQWAYSGGSADECATLALAALKGGDLVKSGNLIPSVMATIVVVLADREEAGDVWAAMIDQAHASGSLDYKAATSVCGGYGLLRQGELADAEASLRDGIEELNPRRLDQRPHGDRGLAGRGGARAREPRRRAARAGGGERARRRLAGRALLARQPRRAAARRGAVRAGAGRRSRSR